MGYCIAPEALMKEFRKVHQFNVFTCNAPMQYAIADFILEKDHYLNLGKFLQNKRDFFANLMKQTPFEPLPSFGSYFQLYSYKNISTESESDFAIKLTQDAGVASIPVSAFYKTPIDNKVLRFCFAKNETTLTSAVDRLVTYFNK
jgi:methionine aminotransferase